MEANHTGYGMNTVQGEMSTTESVDEIGLILSGVVMLQELDFDAVQDISRRMKVRCFGAGEALFKQGSRGDRLYVVYSGSINVNENGNARRLGKGTILGELTLLTSKPCQATFVAAEETRTLYLTRPHFFELMALHSGFAETMSRLMIDHLEHNAELHLVRDYRLLKKLGDGFSASVFEAIDPSFNRRVAVKMLNYSLTHDQKFLRRFEQEENRISGLNHPNIVHVHALLREHATRFVIMEKQRGRPLEKVLEEHGVLSVARTREILFPVAAALRYAHNQGVLHRGIRPSNIFVDDAGNVKVSDFGLSCPTLYDSGVSTEAALYLAPEITSEGVESGFGDIYALGVAAFYMLAGRPPFTAADPQQLAELHQNVEAPDIRELCPEVDEDMALFIGRALQKDVAERIADWNLIRVLLRPGARRDHGQPTGESFAFEVHLHQAQQQQAASVIRQLKQTLNRVGISHDIIMLHDDAGTLE